MVQSDCTVYIALPSPIKANTLRLGQATAAPTAAGKPQPIAPPVMSMQSCGAACGRVLANWRPEVTASSTMMAFSGKVAAMMAPKCSTEGVPVGKSVMMGPVDNCAGAVFCAPKASTRACRLASMSCVSEAKVCTSQSGCLIMRGLFG